MWCINEGTCLLTDELEYEGKLTQQCLKLLSLNKKSPCSCYLKDSLRSSVHFLPAGSVVRHSPVSPYCTCMIRYSCLWETLASWTDSMRQDFLNSRLVACHNPSLSCSRGAEWQPEDLHSLIPLQHLAQSLHPPLKLSDSTLAPPFPPLLLLLYSLLDLCFFPLISNHQTDIKSPAELPVGLTKTWGGTRRHLSSVKCSDRADGLTGVLMQLPVSETFTFQWCKDLCSGVSVRAPDSTFSDVYIFNLIYWCRKLLQMISTCQSIFRRPEKPEICLGWVQAVQRWCARHMHGCTVSRTATPSSSSPLWLLCHLHCRPERCRGNNRPSHTYTHTRCWRNMTAS